MAQRAGLFAVQVQAGGGSGVCARCLMPVWQSPHVQAEEKKVKDVQQQ